MKIVVTDPNLAPHRDRLEAMLPPGSDVRWHPGGAPDEELRDAEVFVGSRFTAEMGVPPSVCVERVRIEAARRALAEGDEPIETLARRLGFGTGETLRRAFHRDYPDDIRPSGLAAFLAHAGTVVEFTVPLVLVLSRGGAVTVTAAAVMLAFHLNILVSLPMGVPLEWNVYMLFGIVFLFVHNAAYGFSDVTEPLPVILLIGALVCGVVLGNLFPRKVSFLIGMRYYAGNWDTSMWCLTPSAVAKIERHVTKAASLPRAQLETLYGPEVADLLGHKGYAFRAMHTHGRALFGLVPRACGPDHETRYVPVDGEFVAGPTVGWNFGEGHLHNERLVAALQERCGFEEGEVRVIVLDAQPIQRQRQEYRLIDAATGEFERGHVEVRDMLDWQAWEDGIPVRVETSADRAEATPRAGRDPGVELA